MSFVLACAWLALLGDPAGTWSLSAERAEVGEPVVATLAVEHDAGARPALALAPLESDGSWVVAREGEGRTEAAGAGRERTAWRIEVASLEPGARSLPPPEVRVGGVALALEPAALEVAGLLGEGEDAPRPLRPLPELPAERSGARAAWIAAAVAALLLLALALAWRRRRARAPAADPLAAPSARLAALAAEPLHDPAAVQAAHYALTRLLREAADLRGGAARAAATDREWLELARPELDSAGLGEAERRELATLFERAEAVKYGAERPTHWATREALAAARALAARLEAVPDGARDGGRAGRRGAAA